MALVIAAIAAQLLTLSEQDLEAAVQE